MGIKPGRKRTAARWENWSVVPRGMGIKFFASRWMEMKTERECTAGRAPKSAARAARSKTRSARAARDEKRPA